MAQETECSGATRTVELDAEHVGWELRATGVPAVVVGGVAVRTYLSDPSVRITNDVDIVVPIGSEEATRRTLTSLGYSYFTMGPWRRAEAPGSRIDVAFGLVVDLASYVGLPVATDGAVHREIEGVTLPVATAEELVAMKLIAHRDKDLLDVVGLLREGPLDDLRFRRLVAEADVEIAVRRGMLELLAGIDLGTLAELWSERTGRPLDPQDWQGVADAARSLVGD